MTMKFEIISKGIDKSEVFERKALRVLEGFGEFFGKDTKYRLVYRKEDRFKIVEITVKSKLGVFRAEKKNEEIYAALKETEDTLWRSVRRVKAKEDRKRRDKSLRVPEVVEVETADEVVVKIDRVKKVAPSVITKEEAVELMLRLGHSFFVFIDKDTGNSSVVYKREEEKHGVASFGVIEVEKTLEFPELEALA